MKRQPADPYAGPKVVGIDVSHHNGPVTWKGIQTDFAFVRTGDGKDIDRRFEENIKGATDHVAFVGTYRYLRTDRGGRFQAELDLELVAKAGVDLTLPMVGDVEQGIEKNLEGGIYGDHLGTIPIEVVAEELLEYLETIERETGVRPMIYGGQYLHWKFAQARPNLAARLAKYALWVASYVKGDSPWMPVDHAGQAFPWTYWTFWQYTSKGSIKGIQGNVDLNYFRGDISGLRAFSQRKAIAGCAPSAVIEQLEELAACFQKTDGASAEAIRAAANTVRAYEAKCVADEKRARRHRRGT